MFYVMGQHRQAMINERVKKALKSRKYADCKQLNMPEIERLVDEDILKGKTIKLSSYYDSPAPAIQVAELARKNGAKKVIVQYFYFEGIGKSKKKKTGIYTNEASFRLTHPSSTWSD